MIKKVKVDCLRLGMYIHDLNCGWMGHPFLWNSFMLRKQEDLEKLRMEHNREVYIDTLKGLDEEGAMGELEPGQVLVSVQTELPIAITIRSEATTVVSSVLQDVRLGRQVSAERMEPVVSKITDSILRNPGALMSLCRLKEGDAYTFQHSVSVATLLMAFCRFMGMDRATLMEVGVGGMLHDLGKMRVPDHILNKPGKLEAHEFDIMKGHVNLGVEVLRETPGVSPTMIQIAMEHHERFDGTGYPLGLVGEAISPLGRMAAIVDVYDAITSKRVYHTEIEPVAALQKIYSWSGHHFDPTLVQHFIQAIGVYPVGSLVRLESGYLALVVDQGEKGLLQPRVRIILDAHTRRAVPPKEVDMGEEGVTDRIVSEEDPHDWRLDTARLMGFKR